MTGTLKTPKTLDNLAWIEMEPVIIEHEKMVRNWTFWVTLLFCCLFCCFVGGSVSVCAFTVKFGLPFELLRKKIMKKIPCGKCLDACSKGNYKEASGHAKVSADKASKKMRGINESSSESNSDVEDDA